MTADLKLQNEGKRSKTNLAEDAKSNAEISDEDDAESSSTALRKTTSGTAQE
jgi:hypothetical protein